MAFSLRRATLEDSKDLERMIVELNAFHDVSSNRVTQTELEQDGFKENPFFHVIIAEVPEQHKSENGYTKVGCAFYFNAYSILRGRAVHLEALYVMAEFRGKGIGKALLKMVAKEGVAVGCKELVLLMQHWNKSASGFYARQGCSNLTTAMGLHWMSCHEEALKKLVES